MKRKKLNSLYLILIFLVVLVLAFSLFVLSTFSTIKNIRLTNIKESEVSNVLSEFDNKYKDYSISVVQSFTHLVENGYLRLIGMKKFDNVYASYNYDYLHVTLSSGKWPTNDNEVVLPDYMKKGSDISNKYNFGYEKNDSIKINTSSYYSLVTTNLASGSAKEVEVKYSISCSKDIPFVKDETSIYKEYKVVGFYKPVILEEVNYIVPSDFTNYGDIDVITYNNLENINESDRINIVFELKKYSFSKNKFSDFVIEFENKYDRYEESELASLKTCNDNVSLYYATDEEHINIYK